MTLLVGLYFIFFAALHCQAIPDTTTTTMRPKDPNVHKLPFSATSQGSRLGMVLSQNHARFVEEAEHPTPEIINWKTSYHTNIKKTTNGGSKKDFSCPRFREYVGNVPLIDLSHLVPNEGVTLYAKCEFLNPSMNGLDRLVKRYVGTLGSPGKTLVAAGNTHIGVSLVMACAWFGHDCILTIPSTLDEVCMYTSDAEDFQLEFGKSTLLCHYLFFLLIFWIPLSLSITVLTYSYCHSFIH